MALSAAQQDIVDLVKQGVTEVSQLAKRLKKSDGIIKAQLTRIRNANEGHLVSKVTGSPVETASKGSRPVNVTPQSDNARVVQGAVDAGPAVYDIPQSAIDAARMYTQDSDVHPMVLLGTTIQYCKLVGGRLSAHQLIEEVYEALRVMVSDGSPRVGQEDWTAPWPLNAVEMENESLKAENAELRERLGMPSEAVVS